MNNTSITQSSLQTTLNKLNNYYKQNFDHLISEIIKICEIPAPTFNEDARGNYIIEKLQKYSQLKIHKDSAKNVIIRYPGTESTAKLAILAHLDTVFSDTEIKVIKNDTTLSAPGIGDNSTSVGTLKHIIESWIDTNFVPPFDVLFVTNSCEEGLGDLKGVRGFMDDYCNDTANKVDLKTLISIDGTLERVTHIGTGVKRYEIVIHTHGGHSWASFGEEPSAIHIIGNIIADISKLKVPEVPKTTYNVGLVRGGTSINTIAEEASILVDLRSTDNTELERLNQSIMSIVQLDTKNMKDVKVDINLVGNRPSGKIDTNHPLVKLVKQAAKENESKFKPTSGVASTDANIPLSRNIPAVAIGCYSGKGAHTKNETVIIDSLHKGVPFVNLVILKALSWIEESSK